MNEDATHVRVLKEMLSFKRDEWSDTEEGDEILEAEKAALERAIEVLS